jgi:hypothetical protein
LALFLVAIFLIFCGPQSASDGLAMISVKLPKIRGERRDFDVWKKSFLAFGLMQKGAHSLLSDGAAFSQQQVDM